MNRRQQSPDPEGGELLAMQDMVAKMQIQFLQNMIATDLQQFGGDAMDVPLEPLDDPSEDDDDDDYDDDSEDKPDEDCEPRLGLFARQKRTFRSNDVPKTVVQSAGKQKGDSFDPIFPDFSIPNDFSTGGTGKEVSGDDNDPKKKSNEKISTGPSPNPNRSDPDDFLLIPDLDVMAALKASSDFDRDEPEPGLGSGRQAKPS